MSKKLLSLIMAALMCSLIFVGCGSSGDGSADSQPASSSTAADDEYQQALQDALAALPDLKTYEGDELLTGKHHAEIVVADYGTIDMELDADVAPQSVSNFVYLAKSGFYDGLTFHRIIDGFMIQGGDPLGDGTGGCDWRIQGEFSSNGIANSLSHVRGTVSMARSGISNDSAGSQFFICQADSTYLDGSYAAFGTVTSGMEVVDAICADTPVQDTNGTVDAADQPVITSVTILD